MKYNIFVKRFSNNHLKKLNKRQLKKLKYSGWFSDRMEPTSFKCDNYHDIADRKLDDKIYHDGRMFRNIFIHVYDNEGQLVSTINGHWEK